MEVDKGAAGFCLPVFDRNGRLERKPNEKMESKQLVCSKRQEPDIWFRSATLDGRGGRKTLAVENRAWNSQHNSGNIATGPLLDS